MNPPNSSTPIDIEDGKSSTHENSIPIDAKLYKLLVNGSKEVMISYHHNLSKYKSKKQNNSVLHIAAGAGQAALITDILQNQNCNTEQIMRWKNIKGDLALHSAARAGRFNVLKAFIHHNGFSKEVLGSINKEGNTVLHIALQYHTEKMAQFLFEEYPVACYQLNYDNVSPLYLGINLGYWTLVKNIISYTKDNKRDAELPLLQGKSVVHAAIQAKNIDILKELLSNHENLMNSRDDEGRTPLSYAAFKGFLEGVKYLLKEFPDSAYKCDMDDEDSLPIHKAASGGNIKVIDELHYTKLLLNSKDQNILHLAAASGKHEVVSYLLKAMDLEHFINMQDEDGNTPLHLASKGLYPRVVYILTRDNRCKCELHNKDGLTALDLTEIYCGPIPSFDARLTWSALTYVNAPRSTQSIRLKYVNRKGLKVMHRRFYKENDKYELENFKGRVDTLLLVATIVATVTFAAGFTLPGGYEQSDPNKGMVVLTRNWAFNAFVFTNTFAMYSSILVVVSLTWAQLDDLKIVLISMRFALPLFIISLAMMSLAFLMGLFAVLKTITWLSYVVFGMGSLFVLIVLGLSIPLYNPSYIKSPVIRCFYSNILFLFILLNEIM